MSRRHYSAGTYIVYIIDGLSYPFLNNIRIGLPMWTAKIDITIMIEFLGGWKTIVMRVDREQKGKSLRERVS